MLLVRTHQSIHLTDQKQRLNLDFRIMLREHYLDDNIYHGNPQISLVLRLGC